MNIQVAVLAVSMTMVPAMAPVAASAATETGSARVALVIGNASYRDSEAPPDQRCPRCCRRTQARRFKAMDPDIVKEFAGYGVR